MPRQHEQQDQTNQTLPVIRGSAEPLIFVHRWDSPRRDIQYSNPHKETHRGEEVDSPAEVEAVSQEEEAEEVDSPAEEAQEDKFLNQEIRTQGTD